MELNVYFCLIVTSEQRSTAIEATSCTRIVIIENAIMTENLIVKVQNGAPVRKLRKIWFYSNACFSLEIECSVPLSMKKGRYIFKDRSKSKYYHNERIEFKCDEGYAQVHNNVYYEKYLLYPCLPISYHFFSRNNKQYLVPGLEWPLEGDPEIHLSIKTFASPGGHIICGINGWRNVPDCRSTSIICNHNTLP